MMGQSDNLIDGMTEQLMLYLDDGLDAQARQALEARLAQSPELTAELDRLRALDERLDALGAVELMSSEQVDRAVWQAAARMRRPMGPRWAGRLVRVAGVAAALLVAAWVGYASRSLDDRASLNDTGPRRLELIAGADPSGRAIVASGQLRLVETDGGPSSTVMEGSALAWDQPMVADGPARIALGVSAQLSIDAGAVVRLTKPVDGGLPRVAVSGGRWRLTGSDLAGAVIVTDSGTVRAESSGLELVSEPAASLNGGEAGPTGVAVTVFAGVVTIRNASGQITVGAGEMAVVSAMAAPVKRVWEPSVDTYVDALTGWYALTEDQQYEVGQLAARLRREQEWLFGPHEQELAELRGKLDGFWLSALEQQPSDTRVYLANYARYRELGADSPYRLSSMLERVETMLPAAQLSRAWSASDASDHLTARDPMARRLGVADATLRYVRDRYRLTDEQLVELEQHLRASRPEGELARTDFDDLLAAIAAVVPAEQIRRTDRRAWLPDGCAPVALRAA